MIGTTLTIEIRQIDLEAFKRRQEQFTILEKAGVFDFKNGSIEIHKKPDGSIQKIDFHETRYYNSLSTGSKF